MLVVLMVSRKYYQLVEMTKVNINSDDLKCNSCNEICEDILKYIYNFIELVKSHQETQKLLMKTNKQLQQYKNPKACSPPEAFRLQGTNGFYNKYKSPKNTVGEEVAESLIISEVQQNGLIVELVELIEIEVEQHFEIIIKKDVEQLEGVPILVPMEYQTIVPTIQIVKVDNIIIIEKEVNVKNELSYITPLSSPLLYNNQLIKPEVPKDKSFLSSIIEKVKIKQEVRKELESVYKERIETLQNKINTPLTSTSTPIHSGRCYRKKIYTPPTER
jgi:hypothetical protein